MINAYFDGICDPNPNLTGSLTCIGLIVKLDIGKDVELLHHFITPTKINGIATNISAYYLSILKIFDFIIKSKMENEEIIIQGCAALIIKQMKGENSIGDGHYRPFACELFDLISTLKNVDFKWIPKDELKSIINDPRSFS